MQLFEKTSGDFLEYWAEKTPDKEFIVYSDRNLRFTYSEFNQRVNNLAKGLMAIGVKEGSHVGIWATNVPDWNTFLFATAKIGAVLVTVNTNYKQHELEYLVDNADLHTTLHFQRYIRYRLSGNDLHHVTRTENFSAWKSEKQKIALYAQRCVYRSREAQRYVQYR